MIDMTTQLRPSISSRMGFCHMIGIDSWCKYER